MSAQLSIFQLSGFRHRLGLTQAEFATLMGVHRNSVINWESGRSGIPGPVLTAMDCLLWMERDHVLKAYLAERLGRASKPSVR